MTKKGHQILRKK